MGLLDDMMESSRIKSAVAEGVEKGIRAAQDDSWKSNRRSVSSLDVWREYEANGIKMYGAERWKLMKKMQSLSVDKSDGKTAIIFTMISLVLIVGCLVALCLTQPIKLSLTNCWFFIMVLVSIVMWVFFFFKTYGYPEPTRIEGNLIDKKKFHKVTFIISIITHIIIIASFVFTFTYLFSNDTFRNISYWIVLGTSISDVLLMISLIVIYSVSIKQYDKAIRYLDREEKKIIDRTYK